MTFTAAEIEDARENPRPGDVWEKSHWYKKRITVLSPPTPAGRKNAFRLAVCCGWWTDGVEQSYQSTMGVSELRQWANGHATLVRRGA